MVDNREVRKDSLRNGSLVRRYNPRLNREPAGAGKPHAKRLRGAEEFIPRLPCQNYEAWLCPHLHPDIAASCPQVFTHRDR
jgi:hypothetical protein